MYVGMYVIVCTFVIVMYVCMGDKREEIREKREDIRERI